MARILHIDTSGPTGIVMLAENGKPLQNRTSEGERDHAGKLNGLVADVLAAAGLELNHLDAIAVCNGPGSYTGLRIGLATAKGYCYVLDKALILHNRLTLMLRELAAESVDNDASALAIIPARAGEYYVAAQGTFATPPRHIMTGELLAAYGNTVSLDIIGEAGTDLNFPSVRRRMPHRELGQFIWAAETLQSFIKGEFAEVAYSEPEYLKPAYITASRADR